MIRREGFNEEMEQMESMSEMDVEEEYMACSACVLVKIGSCNGEEEGQNVEAAETAAENAY